MNEKSVREKKKASDCLKLNAVMLKI